MGGDGEAELARDLIGDHAGARLTQLDKRKLDVPGASGIVALTEGRFAIADDDKGIYEVVGDEGHRTLSSKRHKVLKDLEGICRSPDGGLLALSERTGKVLRIALDAGGGVDPAAAPVEVGKLPRIGKGRNKGWEGLDLLPASHTPDGLDRIVAVHEGYPRAIGLFRLPDLEEDALLDLPAAVEEEALDLSDVAFEQSSGRLFVLSDESATLVELLLTPDPWAVEAVAVHRLDLSRDEKAEALDFDAEGTLWLGTDRKARLYQLRVDRD